ncbi:metallophosphoesterase [Acinetobacter sp.]|uniref:metallophosphoesterase n=1 Tax=Acinetobacter sp. TaxID=472 RepID=UPI003890ADC8
MKPKYIRVASDLHLEGLAGQREEFLALTVLPADPRDAESVLVLAGDISSKPEQLIAFLGFLKDRFLKIIYIPGNHEWYGHEMAKWTMDMMAALGGYFEGEGVIEFSGCGVGCIELEGVRFIFTTLWADGGKTLADHANVSRYLNDFRVIKLGDKKFTVGDMKVLHRAQKEKLVEFLKLPFEGKTVVATHHLPSYRLCHPRFGGDANGGFASNCDPILVGDAAPHLWIHGHTHDTIDTTLWKTRIVCNPMGYHTEWGSVHTVYGPKFITIETMEELEPVRPAAFEP